MKKHLENAVVSSNHGLSKVSLHTPVQDKVMPYLPYCNNGWHRGVVIENHQLCEQRNCRHYKRLYINNIPFYERACV